MKNSVALGAALAAACASTSAFAQNQTNTLPEVLSQSTILTPAQSTWDLQEDRALPTNDGGSFLMSIPGVSGSRMGSHGIDPSIRGQNQSRLNIIDDGVFVHGGCPNRMDPPSSFLSLDGNDELIVQKGYSSVQHGPGGSGGSVITKRNTPVFEDGKNHNTELSAGYDSNGDTRNASAKTTVNFGSGYVRANAEMKRSRSYEDGSGRDVRAGFKNFNARMDVGFTPSTGTDITLGIQMDDTSDALYAGAGMDAPEATMAALRGAVSHKADLGYFDQLNASAYVSKVDHIMDNFSLRDRAAAMGMQTDSNTRIMGGKLTLENVDTNVGLDIKSSYQDALRYMGMQTNIYAAGNEHAYMWPGLHINQVGLFGEHSYDLSAQNRIKLGLRYDYVHVNADRANAHSARTGRSASQLYQMYYGNAWDSTTEHNLGGLLRFEHQFNNFLGFYANASRSVRTADATERAMAGDHASAGNRWVGNPDIDPEAHHQIELGSSYHGSNFSINGSVFYNKVHNYILRDQARGQDGILLSDNADIYRNVDATLMGYELSTAYQLNSALSLTGGVAYTRGENDDDNRNLAQIAPLEFNAGLEYGATDWLAGVNLRGAAKQNRADLDANNNSGLDTEKTGGYAVLDVYGQIWAFEPFDVSLGVSNLFDKTYSNHLNRASAFDNDVTKVNEPGRSFFIRVNAEF